MCGSELAVGHGQTARMAAPLLLVLLLAVTSAQAFLRAPTAGSPPAEAAAALALLPPTLSVNDTAEFQVSHWHWHSFAFNYRTPGLKGCRTVRVKRVE